MVQTLGRIIQTLRWGRNTSTGWEGDALVLPYRWSFRNGEGCAQREIYNLAKNKTIKITNVILHNFAADKKVVKDGPVAKDTNPAR